MALYLESIRIITMLSICQEENLVGGKKDVLLIIGNYLI